MLGLKDEDEMHYSVFHRANSMWKRAKGAEERLPAVVQGRDAEEVPRVEPPPQVEQRPEVRED